MRTPAPERTITEEPSARHGRSWRITPGTLFAADLKTVVAILTVLLAAAGTAVAQWQSLGSRVGRLERDMLTRTDLLSAEIACERLYSGDMVCRVRLDPKERGGH